jgi:hypothetical protein
MSNNPLFQALTQSNPQNSMMGNFQNFMQQMQGKNPHEEIAKLLQSGRISQEQLNQAQQMAQQFMGMFNR